MQNLNVLCRTCLKETGKIYPLIHTFSGHEDINFAVMLMSCTSISIESEDALPHSICENCISSLIMAYIFKQQCEKSDLFLRTHECIKSFKASNQKLDHSYKTNESTINVDATEEDKASLKSISDDKKINKKIFINSKKLLVVRRKYQYKNEEHEENMLESDNKQKKYHEGDIRGNKKRSKIYTCIECNKQFVSRYGLMYHAQNHLGIKKYVCPIETCKKRFVWQPALKRHMQIHSTEKKFLCNLCGKAYNAADSLRYHIRTHTGERPWLCVSCGKTYTQAVHLKYHMRIHNDDRPHVCLKCNRSYTRPNQLKVHLNKYCGIGRIPPRRIRKV